MKAVPVEPPPPAQPDEEQLRKDRSMYAIAMRFTGVILLLLGIGLIYMQCKFVVSAHYAGVLGRIGWHMAVILEFVLLYVFLGVMAVRLYSWAAYFITGILAVVVAYGVYSAIAGADQPDLVRTAGIGVTVFIGAVFVLSLLAVIKARKIRALGFDPRGDGKPPERALAGSIFTGVLLVSLSATFAGMQAADAGAGGQNPGKSAGEDATWRVVTVREGFFSVEMPGTPKRFVTTSPSDAGTIRYVNQRVVTRDDFFTAVWVDFPDGFIEKAAANRKQLFDVPESKAATCERLLDFFRDAMVKEHKAKVTLDKSVADARFPTRILVAEQKHPDLPLTLIWKQVMVIAGGEMYATETRMLSNASRQVKADAERFHESAEVNVKK